MEMRFEINADVLKQWCDVIMAFDDEVKIMIDSEKWTVKKPDPAHVSMVDTDIPISAFEIFNTGYPDDVINGSPIEIGTDLNKMSNFLKVFTANQRKKKNVIIEYDLEENRFSYIIGQLTRKGEMLDPSNIVDTKVPKYNWNVEITTTAEEVLRAIKAAKKTTDFVLFTQQNGSFQIHAQDDNDTTVFPFPDSTITGQYEGYRTMYTLSYLYDMLKNVKKGDIRISSGTDEPLKIDYINNAEIRFALLMAPRIEGDDDNKPTPTPQQQETEEPEEVQETPEETMEEEPTIEEVPELEPIPEEEPSEPEPETDEIVIEILAEDIQIGVPDETTEEPTTEPINIAEDLEVMGSEHTEETEEIPEEHPEEQQQHEERPKVVKLKGTEITGEIIEYMDHMKGVRVKSSQGIVTFWRNIDIEAVA